MFGRFGIHLFWWFHPLQPELCPQFVQFDINLINVNNLCLVWLPGNGLRSWTFQALPDMDAAQLAGMVNVSRRDKPDQREPISQSSVVVEVIVVAIPVNKGEYENYPCYSGSYNNDQGIGSLLNARVAG